RLSVNVKSRTGEMLAFEIFSKNIERLDVFLNGRPQKSVDVKEEITQITLDISFSHLSVLEIQGFHEEHLVASAKIDLSANSH
ncbi:MAG TPA: hypothetical protein VK186_11425, partial [Candidatus Deferrimicrobium sp.]|nr:hypothetical protein [Candidatus Deferrimicrobium sp.]